jgi:hypothetical protein
MLKALRAGLFPTERDVVSNIRHRELSIEHARLANEKFGILT